MVLFYAVAGALALGTAILLVRPLLGRAAAPDDRDASDAALYRDQLDEIGRDLARGTISAAEAEGARAEVARRLLSAKERASGTPARSRRGPAGVVLAVVAVPLLAAGLYLAEGAPGMPDLPLATRPAVSDPARPNQAEAEVAFGQPAPEPETQDARDYAALIARVEKIVAERPDDIEGRRLLAAGYARLGRNADAWRVFADLIRLLGPAAEPDLLESQLDSMVLAAGGYVSPEAEAVLAQARERNPKGPIVRYYEGLVMAQEGRLPEAVRHWEELRAEAPADAPWAGFLDQMLAEAKAAMTGAPSRDAMEAAAGMSPEERQAMIEGMVARLEDRLATEGGTLEEWLRLLNALKQLGRMDDARRAYAQGAAALDASEAGALREQALLMGVITE